MLIVFSRLRLRGIRENFEDGGVFLAGIFWVFQIFFVDDAAGQMGHGLPFLFGKLSYFFERFQGVLEFLEILMRRSQEEMDMGFEMSVGI